MKHLPLFLAACLYLGLALALWMRHPEPADDSLFAAPEAPSPELAPLVLPGGTLELSGHVSSAAGEPAADAFVVLARREGDPSRAEPLYHAYTDEQGRFTLHALEPGTYRVVLMHPSAPPSEFEVELPSAGPEVHWTLAPPLPPLPVLPEIRRGSVTGRVLAPALWEKEAHALEGFEVVLRPAPGTPALSGACERRAITDAEGRFALDELVVAQYEVELLPPWARGGSWPALARGTCAAREGAPSELALRPEVGELEGQVNETGPEALAGALVEVTALDARDAVGKPQLWPTDVTDAQGHFRIELLPPGRYHLHVRAGPAARDVDVAVEAGKRVSVPLEPLELGPVPAGGD